jgi:hypothetical protein
VKTAVEAKLATKFGKSTTGSPIFSGYSFGKSSLQQIQNQKITVRQPLGVSSGPLSAVRPWAVRPSAPRELLVVKHGSATMFYVGLGLLVALLYSGRRRTTPAQMRSLTRRCTIRNDNGQPLAFAGRRTSLSLCRNEVELGWLIPARNECGTGLSFSCRAGLDGQQTMKERTIAL